MTTLQPADFLGVRGWLHSVTVLCLAQKKEYVSVTRATSLFSWANQKQMMGRLAKTLNNNVTITYDYQHYEKIILLCWVVIIGLRVIQTKSSLNCKTQDFHFWLDVFFFWISWVFLSRPFFLATANFAAEKLGVFFFREEATLSTALTALVDDAEESVTVTLMPKFLWEKSCLLMEYDI